LPEVYQPRERTNGVAWIVDDNFDAIPEPPSFKKQFKERREPDPDSRGSSTRSSISGYYTSEEDSSPSRSRRSRRMPARRPPNSPPTTRGRFQKSPPRNSQKSAPRNLQKSKSPPINRKSYSPRRKPSPPQRRRSPSLKVIKNGRAKETKTSQLRAQLSPSGSQRSKSQSPIIRSHSPIIPGLPGRRKDYGAGKVIYQSNLVCRPFLDFFFIRTYAEEEIAKQFPTERE
jgi:hypothetical protein